MLLCCGYPMPESPVARPLTLMLDGPCGQLGSQELLP